MYPMVPTYFNCWKLLKVLDFAALQIQKLYFSLKINLLTYMYFQIISASDEVLLIAFITIAMS